jgi:Domain of unknown function (DUF929)
MGNAARTQRRSTSSASRKIAAQRAAQRARRKRLLLGGGSVAAVIVIVVAFIAVKALTKQPVAAKATTTALTNVVQEVTSVPASALNSVGAGGVTGLEATQGHQPPLTLNGKPEVLYMGGEYCPYCAAERWALTAALSRFGTFSGLRFIHSAADDGDIATLTFDGSHYTSRYLSFVPVEWYSENERVTLQTPTSAQLALFTKYDAAPYTTQTGGFPFVDLGNKDLILGSQYVPTDLSGLTWEQIGAALASPGSTVAKDIDGAANTITAGLCKLTGSQPASVCTSPGVKAAA